LKEGAVPGSREVKRESIQDFLLTLLSGGPIPAATVKVKGEEAGFSWDPLDKAARGMGSIERFKKGNATHWKLKGPGAKEQWEKRIQDLQEQMDIATKEENYERSAELKKEIEQLHNNPPKED
jgi:hypothetical protein